MGILSRYFLTSFLRTFAAVLVIVALAVAIVDTMLELDDLLGAVAGLRGMLHSVLLRILADHLVYLIPISAFVAAFVAIGTAARRAEILAVKAGGISPLRIVVPLLAAAALISGFALVLYETATVEASRALRRQLGKDGSEVAFRRGSFWYHRGRFVYNVRDADPDTHSLRGVAVFELDERGRLVRTIDAERAEITPEGDWRLQRATIRRIDPDRPAATPHFEQVQETHLALSSDPDLTLLQASVSELSIRDLREFLDARPGPGVREYRARVLLNQRLTEPLTALLFALLAIPLGLRVERTRSLALPALHGVILLFLFYLVREYGSTLAVQGVAPAVATPWAILAAFGAFGLVQLARAPR